MWARIYRILGMVFVAIEYLLKCTLLVILSLKCAAQMLLPLIDGEVVVGVAVSSGD